MDFETWFAKAYPQAVDGFDYDIGDMKNAYAAGQQAQRELSWLEAAELLEHCSIATDALADKYERKLLPMYAAILREQAAAIRRGVV